MIVNKPKIERYDVTDFLDDEEDVLAYLNAAFEDGHADVVAQAIGNVARARGMSRIAKRCRLGRESLYKSLSDRGNPEFRTILSVLNAMGIRLRVEFDHNERP
ncbi:MAG: addiction module antidote protein [Gammaproteobacteria bacterium]|nr:addiction module antidote protein [Gammaproteobacteria bacterium]